MSNKVNKKKYEGMDSLVTAVIVCDKNLIVNYINPSTETLFEAVSYTHLTLPTIYSV